MAKRYKPQKDRTLGRLMRVYARAEAADAEWYRQSQRSILQHTRPTLLAGLLAATSPRCTVPENARRALNLYHDDDFLADPDAGSRALAPLMPNVRGNVMRAAFGQPLKGLKVEPFRRALLGDPDAVTVDVWMLRAAYDDPNRMYAPRVREVTWAVRYMAEHYVEACARDVQAAIWAQVRTEHGYKNDNRGYAPYL